MNDIENTPEVVKKPANPKPRLYRLSPDRFVFALLLIEVVLLLSERFSWFAFNERKGLTLLIAVAVFGVALLFLLLWFIAASLLRRRFQYGIRFLLTLTIIVAILGSWFAVKIEQAKRQKEAVESLGKLPGEVRYEDDYDGLARTWLQKWFGKDFSSDVTVAYLYRFEVTDSNLELLDGMDQLRELDVIGPGITDAGLKTIGRLTHLRNLYCLRTPITDAGLKHLERLSDLEEFVTSETQITDAGLETIGRFSGLSKLALGSSQITDDGLKHLATLTKLQSLSIESPRVTDAGLTHLEGLTTIRCLILTKTKVTDKGIADLKKVLPNVGIERK